MKSRRDRRKNARAKAKWRGVRGIFGSPITPHEEVRELNEAIEKTEAAELKQFEAGLDELWNEAQ